MKYQDKILLPAGFHDLLPPEAALESRSVTKLLNIFARHGYEQVKPPLIEFESSLTFGQAKALRNQTFRLMDPISHETMAIRADMTTQIARIASTRLHDKPLPLRLSYSGQVMRVKGSGLYAERQMAEAGIELIGSVSPEADAEVILIAGESLKALRIRDFSIDFSLPNLANIVIQDLGTPEILWDKMLDLIDKKDFEGIQEIRHRSSRVIVQLLSSTGPAKKILPNLATMIELPKKAREHCQRLREVIEIVAKADPKLKLTIDPLEYRGFEYHSGSSFSIFSKKAQNELGRGGRYRVIDYKKPEGEKHKGDGAEKFIEAVGFTLYINTILRTLPKFRRKPRIYLPIGIKIPEAEALRKQGMITISGLEKVKDIATEAKRLGCSHYYDGGVKEI